MTPEERASDLLSRFEQYARVAHPFGAARPVVYGALVEAIRAAEDDALERAACEVEAGFALVPRSASWNDKREMLADRVRGLKSTGGGR